MNIYELSRAFWNYAFEHPDTVKPNHIALYFFAIEHCNRLGWKEKFGFPTGMVKDAIGIKSYNTYKATLNELVEMGFITMIEKSTNQYSANIIAISKNDKSQYKALDKAMIEHSNRPIKKEQTTVQSTSESTVQSKCSIDIPIYQSTNTPINNVLLEKEPKEKKIEKKVSEDDSDKISEVQERKKVAPKKESLEMPEEFFPIWQDWIDYRKARKLKPYAGAKYEQIAVNKLLELSNKDPVTAKKILEQTYQNNYQGFFELKENYGKSIISTGTNENNTSSRQATFNIREASERLAADFETGNILGVYKK